MRLGAVPITVGNSVRVLDAIVAAINSVAGRIDVSSVADQLLVQQALGVVNDNLAGYRDKMARVLSDASWETLKRGGERAVTELLAADGLRWEDVRAKVRSAMGDCALDSVLEKARAAYEGAVALLVAATDKAFSDKLLQQETEHHAYEEKILRRQLAAAEAEAARLRRRRKNFFQRVFGF
jgi:hypothetical protein